MRTIFRSLLWLIAGLTFLFLCAVGLGWYLVSRSEPDYGASFVMAGTDEPVEIVRDANAVPHIYASTDRDAYFALGVVHAQDRLWQMEVTRRGAQGRLSEIFGVATLPLDRQMRVFDLYTLARQSVNALSPEALAALNAYSDGVNAWISTINTDALGRGAPEFFLFNEGLSPWTPADSLAVLKIMALRLTGAAASETRRANLLRQVSPERLDDLFPTFPGTGVMALPRFAEAYQGLPFRADVEPEPAHPLSDMFFPKADFAGASNAWAIDGQRTATGAPLLANDPHLWLSTPSIWMLAHVEFPDVGVIGGSIAGVPAIFVGRNRDLAWGLTTVGMDDQDVYIEKLNPDNPGEYLTPNGWEAFTQRTERIQVKDAPAEQIELKWSRHGPVLDPETYDVGTVTPEGHVAALSWTALSGDDRSIEALIGLMRATDIEQAVEAGRHVIAPGQNVTVADRAGVGMFTTGLPPRRKQTSRTQGRIPSLGWITDNDWEGLSDYEASPRALRPASGVVANGNNQITNAAFPNHISFDWDAPYRIRRIEQKLNDREYHTADSFMELQNDTVSEMARSVLPVIARDMWWTRDEAEGDQRGDRREDALALLGEWNGEMTEHGPEPLIFMAWMRALTKRIAGDELGSLIGEIEGPRPLFVERVFYDVNGAGEWCDVNKTERQESCAEVAKIALDDALDELVETYGENVTAWRWGEAHFARHVATPLGLRWPTSLIVNIEMETSGGDYTLQRAKTAGKGPDPYRNVHAAGYRAVYDFADLDGSVFIIATGQSGHLLSRHYDDLSEKWRIGEYIPMSMRRDDIDAGALGTMTIMPKEN